MGFWFKRPLYFKIFVMLLLGAVVGYVMGPKASVLNPIGDAFIRLLKMLIVPLVFLTLVSGVTKMDGPKDLKKYGGLIVLYYIMTSALAAVVGTVVALVIRPGLGVQGLLGATTEMKVAKYSVVENVLSWIPTNPVQAMAETNMLQIIFFALMVGIALLLVKEKAGVVIKFFNEASDVIIRITEMIMEIAPYGIFALVANMTGTLGSKMLAAAGKFILADYLAIIIVISVVYPTLLALMGKLSPPKFYRHIFPAMMVAASTTSSAATLPVSMKIAEEKVGVPEKIFGFTLPLGATANMDGFAAALGVISVFAMDIYNQPITVSSILMIVYLGLILSIGAAGVKGAGIVMSAVLFEALGLPLTLLPVLAAVWPIIDIAHTTTNITGDLVGTTLVASRCNELNQEIFNQAQ